IGLRDRGLAYGDGVFRTFPRRDGKPVLWHRQYGKLDQDCRALGIACPPAGTLERELSLLDTADCVVKIIVTRGESARGYAPPAPPTGPTRIIISAPLPQHPAKKACNGVRAHLCRLRLSAQPALAGIKHLNRLENVLARSEWSDPDIAEGLMCNAAGNVIGGTMSNVFIVKNSALVTPSLADCGVAGVMRQLAMELAKAHAIPVQIMDVSLDDLFAADEVFVVNSLIGLWPVIAAARTTWKPGPLSARMQQWIADAQVA
ncbi:MAG TPA: aminodeoxychorismate lyase, partial [Burkholderiales bacterium]|nr:aminodeoxychorismate lyase [Burkholderiales bacterium]